jgi:hypothetical protein
LRANALLALDGSLGHVTEVLSGDYYQPLSTSSPHQIWSAAMVISPLLRGLLGVSLDANASLITLSPHVPSNWRSFSIKNLRAGACAMDIRYHRTDTQMIVDTDRSGTGDCTLEFSPSISPLAEVTGAEMSAHLVNYRLLKSANDQHVVVRYAVPRGQGRLSIMIRNDFGLSWNASLPVLGGTSQGLRVTNESWTASHDRLELDVAGSNGSTYELGVWNVAPLGSVEGAELVRASSEPSTLRIHFPAGNPEAYSHRKIVFHFSNKPASEHGKEATN